MSKLVRLVALTALAAACGAGTRPVPPKEFNGKQALGYVVTQVGFGPRIPGTPGHAAEAHWLDSMARTRADSVTVQRWWYRNAAGDSVEMVNVLAQFNVKATRRILYLAHWDSKPTADRDATNKKAPMPGADDGGSGVAVLLGVADALKKTPPAVGVDLLFVDGEDYGDFGPPKVDVLVGASYYATHQVAAKPAFAVLWDMVGHKDLRIPVEQFSQVAAPEVVERVWGTAQAMGYGAIFTGTIGGITDDHIPLIDAGIPTVDVIDLSYPFWHTTQDTPDKESAESLETVGNVAVGVIRRGSR
jgi:glutaminyl-peptide cyclotransferase